MVNLVIGKIFLKSRSTLMQSLRKKLFFFNDTLILRLNIKIYIFLIRV